MVSEAVLIATLLLAALLLSSGLPKLIDPRPASAAITAALSLAEQRPATGRALGIAECFAGAALAVAAFGEGVPRRVTGLLVTCLFASFSVALAANVARGRRFSCACFGASVRRIGWPHVIRAALLTVVSAGLGWSNLGEIGEGRRDQAILITLLIVTLAHVAAATRRHQRRWSTENPVIRGDANTAGAITK
jgi:hypothetical protein